MPFYSIEYFYPSWSYGSCGFFDFTEKPCIEGKNYILLKGVVSSTSPRLHERYLFLNLINNLFEVTLLVVQIMAVLT